MNKFFVALLTATLVSPAVAQTALKSFTTLAERSNYSETPRYDETLDHFTRLDAASERAQLIEFGTTPQGRKQFAFVIASGGEFTPEKAAASGKPVLFIQAGIHAGENEGKDVLMALARQWLLANEQQQDLDKMILLLVPIFNVDGHERFSPYNRINQNGPKAMGYRTTAQNYNLNRDYVKVESPEMQAWQALWNAWNPALLIDMHNTNGADYQYQLLLHYEQHLGVAPSIREWQKIWNDVSKATDARGFVLGPYLDLKVYDDPKRGMVNNFSLPRFSSGFGVIANRPALLLETHMLKDFRTRARVNHAFLQETVRAIGANPSALLTAVAEADKKAAALAGTQVPINFKIAEATRELDFKGYAYTRTLSEVSGGLWTQYNTKKPEIWRVTLQDQVEVGQSIEVPQAYLIPAQWQAAIEKLEHHGIAFERIRKPMQIAQANTYRFSDVSYQPAPFEGQTRLSAIKSTPANIDLEFPAGSVLVRTDQRHALKILTLLEPDSPDSLVRDGYGAYFLTRAEYAEPRVLERKAREMLAKDAALQSEFSAKLAGDPAFAASASARLDFFYRKLPYYDQRFMVYPVARLDQAQLDALRP
jgi:hypothetical protein